MQPMKRYIQNLFQLILSPGNGWEDIAKGNDNPDSLAARGFYPLIAVVGLSVFFEMLYKSDSTFIGQFLKGIVEFMMFFVSYFIGTFVLSLFISSSVGGKVNEKRNKMFVLYSLGLLSFISILVNCLPVTTVVLFFLPIYVAIIMWKGTAYMGVVPGKEGEFMLIAIPGIIIPPYILLFLFSLLLPS